MSSINCKHGLMLFIIALMAVCLTPVLGYANGIPVPGGMNLQAAATPVKAQLEHLHNQLLTIITVITAMVVVLLLFIAFRFNNKANPVASTTTHNTKLEIIWTLVPVLILVAIAIPSLKTLYFMDRAQVADLTVKAVGRQWYWSYEYPDNGNFTFDSYMTKKEDIKPDQIYLLDVDNPMVVPAGSTVRLLTTGADVIHNWFVPSLGVNIAANPGRTNETWFKIEKPGVYYGQCAQLCGVNHGFMPIKVIALEKGEFDKWVEEAKVKFASLDHNKSVLTAAASYNNNQ